MLVPTWKNEPKFRLATMSWYSEESVEFLGYFENTQFFVTRIKDRAKVMFFSIHYIRIERPEKTYTQIICK